MSFGGKNRKATGRGNFARWKYPHHRRAMRSRNPKGVQRYAKAYIYLDGVLLSEVTDVEFA